jgi:hypothetical protein
MHRLTPQILDNYPYSRYATPQTLQRGRAYYKDGRVWDVDLVSDRKAICLVDGDSGEYTVQIEIDKKLGELNFECDCPYAETDFCKHMIAAALEVSEYLTEEDEEYGEDDEEEFDAPRPKARDATGDWKTKLMQTVALMPRPSTSGNRLNRYAVALLLTRNRYGYYSYGSGQQYSYSLEPVIIRENNWGPLQDIEGFNPDRVNHLLETSRNWIKASERYFQSLNPRGSLNVSSDSIAFIGLARNIGSIYGSVSGHLNNYLSMLARLDIPIFLGNLGYNAKIERRLHILPDPIQIQIDMQQDEEKLSLQAGFDKKGTFTRIQKKIEVMTSNPVWVLMDNTIAQIENSRAVEVLSTFPIEIPNQQVDLFREQYFPLIAQALPIKSGLVKWSDLHADAVPRLYLHDDNKEKVLRASLHFGYGEFDAPLGKDQLYSVASTPIPGNLSVFIASPSAKTIFINCSRILFID